jgi:RNA polymerase sigma factor (sigma-70 family)
MYTDEELLEGCLKGKSAFQKSLYDKYAVKMLGVCMRYIKKQAESEDILQEGFIKVFLKLDTYRGSGNLEGWIRRIMVNTAIQHIRDNVKTEIVTDTGIKQALIEAQPDSGDVYGESITPAELYDMIQSLPDGYKTVFSLYAIDGYSHKEIALLLDISEGTSKSQLSRARAMLKKSLETHQKRKTERIHV